MFERLVYLLNDYLNYLFDRSQSSGVCLGVIVLVNSLTQSQPCLQGNSHYLIRGWKQLVLVNCYSHLRQVSVHLLVEESRIRQKAVSGVKSGAYKEQAQPLFAEITARVCNHHLQSIQVSLIYCVLRSFDLSQAPEEQWNVLETSLHIKSLLSWCGGGIGHRQRSAFEDCKEFVLGKYFHG